MNLTVSQEVTELNLTVAFEGVSVNIKPVIYLASTITGINGGTA